VAGCQGILNFKDSIRHVGEGRDESGADRIE
jgi:hypothetical protein